MGNLDLKFENICSASNIVGASSIIIKDNKIDKILNFGYYDNINKKKMTENTIIRIASVSKLEVAICLMMLEEEGKINLDEDISKYLGFEVRNPNYPNDVITIRMIMTQTSSIIDGLEIYRKDGNIFSGYNLLLEEGIVEPIESLLKKEGKYYNDSFSEYKPGSHFEYSNFGCGTLACILERVSGQYFFDFFKEKVAKKLNINASFMASDLINFEISSSYDNNGKLIRDKASFIKNSIYKRDLGQNYVGPAGGLFISMLDLSKIMLSYMNYGNKLLKKETFEKMLEMNWYGDKCGDYSAKGLQFQILDLFEGKRLYGHFGSAYGIQTHLFFNMDQKIGIVFAMNGGNFKRLPCDVTDVQYNLLASFLDEYWDKEVKNIVRYKINDDFLYVNNRRISVVNRKDSNSEISFDLIKYLDAFNVSTYIGKTFLDANFKDMRMLEFLNCYMKKYSINYEIKTDENKGEIEIIY